MHTRKARMAELSDGFIALPGGIGTLEELFEIWTWSQIGYHTKPIALMDVNGYYAKLIEFLRFSAEQGFVRQQYIDTLMCLQDPLALLDQFDRYQPHNLNRWA